MVTGRVGGKKKKKGRGGRRGGGEEECGRIHLPNVDGVILLSCWNLALKSLIAYLLVHSASEKKKGGRREEGERKEERHALRTHVRLSDCRYCFSTSAGVLAFSCLPLLILPVVVWTARGKRGKGRGGEGEKGKERGGEGSAAARCGTWSA